MMVIGSVAAKYWISGFRDPKDIDVWVPRKNIKELYNSIKNDIISFYPQKSKDKFTAKLHSGIVEIGLYDPNSAHDLILKAQKNCRYINLLGIDFAVPGIKSLTAIKRSHLEFPIKWDKHIEDYMVLKAAKDLGDEDQNTIDEAYKLLHASAESRYNKRKIQLSMSNEDFFAKSQRQIKRIYNHDDIHKAVAHYDAPLYTNIKKDQTSAKCDINLWNNLSHKDKVFAVQEEAFVIALERFIIPDQSHQHDLAFHKALKKICTTLTSGWFRNFAIENWKDCKNYEVDFVQRFNQALNNGAIRSY